MLKRMGLIFGIALMVNLLAYALGYAQDATPAGAPWWEPVKNMLFLSVLPALWAAVGPIATSWITKAVNGANVYVPRPLQVILSGMVAAVGAGLTGDPSGPVQAMMEGATGQVLAATDPAALRTTAKE